MRSFILPALGYIGYPMAVAGALLVFATSTVFTLQMVAANVSGMTSPIAASPDFNVPAVEQIGSLQPPPAARAIEATTTTAQPESSIVAVAPPDHTVAVGLTTPATSSDFEAGALSGRVGSQAVNVRAGPSKTAVTLGVLNAGTPVGIGENVGGWIHVSFNGGDGWVYKSYLETGSSLSIN